MCYEVSSFLIDISQRDHKVVVCSCLSGIRKISLIANVNQWLVLNRQVLKTWMTLMRISDPVSLVFGNRRGLNLLSWRHRRVHQIRRELLVGNRPLEWRSFCASAIN